MPAHSFDQILCHHTLLQQAPVEVQREVCVETGFTEADENKTVQIKSGAITVDGETRRMQWGNATPADCTGRIVSVEGILDGTVKLNDDCKSVELRNPELCRTVHLKFVNTHLESDLLQLCSSPCT